MSLLSEQLDVASFHSASKAERDRFCRKLVSSLKYNGFVRLVNHGIPPSDIDMAFETSRHFFHLPISEKMESPHPPTANPHRGFSPVGLENISAISNQLATVTVPLLKDLKESFDIGSERDELYNNIWPPPGIHDAFKPTFTSFFSSVYRAELVILEAISLGLGLHMQTLSKLHADQTNELRLSYYPAASRDEFSRGSTRIAAHTDFDTITLLFQDNVGGLQMELPPSSGKFADIESGGPYECILNVGDCLQKWTGLHSARHRVHVSELQQGDKAGTAEDVIDERFSIAYFVKPDRTASLRPLIDYIQSKEEAVSGYMTAGEFQNMRIQRTFASQMIEKQKVFETKSMNRP